VAGAFTEAVRVDAGIDEGEVSIDDDLSEIFAFPGPSGDAVHSAVEP